MNKLLSTYGLTRPAFSKDIPPAEMFRTEQFDEALQTMKAAIEGQTSAVVTGDSGSGKSVTALSVLRLIPDPPGTLVGGSVLYKGQDLLKVSWEGIRKVRGNEISMIFQEPMTSLNPVF